jgi:hypothetical protein
MLQEDTAVTPIGVLDEMDRLSQKQLWPGFVPTQYPIAFYTGKDTWLFRHPQPPEGFIRSDEREGAWVFEGRYSEMVANTSTEISGVVTATVMLNNLTDRSPSEIAAIAIHEIFHIFQGEHHPEWSANEADLFSYPSTNVKNYMASILAERALARALEAQDEAIMAAWAKKAMAIRHERMAALGPDHQDYERKTVITEGTANYIEYLALGKTSETKGLNNGFPPEGIRLRCYSVGRGMAALLDKVAPAWKEKLERWPMLPLDYLLEEALSHVEMTEVDFSEDEVREIEEIAETRIAELIEKLKDKRAAFIDSKGWKVTVVVEEGANLLGLRGFDPMNVMMVGEREVLHTRMFRLGGTHGTISMLDPGWTAEGGGEIDALSLGVGPHPIFSGIRRVSYAGFVNEPVVRQEGDAVEISEHGLDLKLKGVKVEKKEREIIITLLK